MKCPACGFEAGSDARFCEECGAKLIELAAAEDQAGALKEAEKFGEHPAKHLLDAAWETLDRVSEELEKLEDVTLDESKPDFTLDSLVGELESQLQFAMQQIHQVSSIDASIPSLPGLLANVHFSHAKCEKLRGKTSEAIARMRKAVQLCPIPSYWILLGVELEKSGEPAEAIEAYLSCRESCIQSGEADKLRELCEGRLSRMSAASPKVQFLIANSLKRRGDYRGAIQQYHEGLRKKPEDAGALFKLGMIYLQQGQDKDALECLDKAAALDPQIAAELKRAEQKGRKK